MQLTAIFFSLAILILVGIYLYAPFMERRARRVTEEEHELSTLMAERDRVINSLQELDFDFKLGKIPEDDYPAQRTSLLQKGADLLRKIDAIAPQPVSVQDADARIEKAIAARRADASVTQAAKAEPSDDDLESMIQARRRGRKENSSGFCPKCGKPVMVSDRFCPSCGKSLT
jgi:NADH pyrophosphatase NudC (nudix superfamily)